MFPPLWLTCMGCYETRMLWYTYVEWWILYTIKRVIQVWLILYRHMDLLWLLLINTITLDSYMCELNRDSPYYNHAPEYVLLVLPYSNNMYQWILTKYNVQHHLLPILQYLSGSPTWHLNLMAKHLLFKGCGHMLILYVWTSVNQSVSMWTRVSDPDDYTLQCD